MEASADALLGSVLQGWKGGYSSSERGSREIGSTWEGGSGGTGGKREDEIGRVEGGDEGDDGGARRSMEGEIVF